MTGQDTACLRACHNSIVVDNNKCAVLLSVTHCGSWVRHQMCSFSDCTGIHTQRPQQVGQGAGCCCTRCATAQSSSCSVSPCTSQGLTRPICHTTEHVWVWDNAAIPTRTSRHTQARAGWSHTVTGAATTHPLLACSSQTTHDHTRATPSALLRRLCFACIRQQGKTCNSQSSASSSAASLVAG